MEIQDLMEASNSTTTTMSDVTVNSQDVSLKRKFSFELTSRAHKTETEVESPTSVCAPSTPEKAREWSRLSNDHSNAVFTIDWSKIWKNLQQWRRQLEFLQPLVEIGDEILYGAIFITQTIAMSHPSMPRKLSNNDGTLEHYAAAAMWLAAKFIGARTRIPNRTLMSQAVRMYPQALSDFELDICCLLDWNVSQVFKRHLITRHDQLQLVELSLMS